MGRPPQATPGDPVRTARRGLLAILVLTTAVACSDSAPRRPTLSAVTPAQGPDEAATPVSILGESLRPRVITDFANRVGSRVDDRWEARIGSTPLLDVHRIDENTLAASVPAGLAPDLYSLTVIDPYAREVVLTDSFRVVRSTVPLALAFSTPPVTLQAGACSGAVTVETRDILGRPALADAALTVTLTGSLPGTGFYSDAACTIAEGEVPIALAKLAATFYFRSPTAGALSLTALSPGLTSAVQTHTVLPNAPAALAFATPPQTVAQGSCSTVATLELQDSLGNAVPAPAQLSVTLQAVPAGTVGFFSDVACAVPAPVATIAGGTMSVNGYFRGVIPGSGAVIASTAGLNPATQQVTVTASGGVGGGAGGGSAGGGGGSAGGGAGGGSAGGGAGGGSGGGSAGGGAGGGGSSSDGGCLVGGAPRCDGGWRDCDSFEAAAIDAHWTQHTGNGTLALTNTCAFRGTQALAVQLPAVSNGGSVGANIDSDRGVIPSPPTTWFVRGYFYVPAPFPPYDLKLIKILENSSASDGVVFRVGAAGLIEVQNDFDTPVSTVSTQLLPIGQWVCVELEVGIGNPANIRAYVDGAMVLNFMQRTSSAPGLSIVRVGEGGTNATAASPARTFYVDDLVISATRVGCAN